MKKDAASEDIPSIIFHCFVDGNIKDNLFLTRCIPRHRTPGMWRKYLPFDAAKIIRNVAVTSYSLERRWHPQQVRQVENPPVAHISVSTRAILRNTGGTRRSHDKILQAPRNGDRHDHENGRPHRWQQVVHSVALDCAGNEDSSRCIRS